LSDFIFSLGDESVISKAPPLLENKIYAGTHALAEFLYDSEEAISDYFITFPKLWPD
jgi:hypothetical protein